MARQNQAGPDGQHRTRARKLLERGAFAAAAEQFRRLVRAAPNSLEDRALLAHALANAGREREAEAELRTAIALAPDSPPPTRANLCACLGQLLARGERRVEAVRHLEDALELVPGHWASSELTELKAQITRSVHSWHLPMLADTARNDAFQAAIKAAVRQDDIVLDIGTGTGLLAMMAARAGARRVVACEMLPDMAALARLVVEANGFSQQITVLTKCSTDLVVGVDLPERASLLVSETFDALLIGEGAIDSFNHAREHLLTQDARVIPVGGVVRAQLAKVPRLKMMHPLTEVSGFDLRAFARHALEKQFYPVALEAEDWTALSEPFDVIQLDFRQRIASRRRWTVPVTATQDGTVQALVLWVELALDGTTSLASGPGGKARHWNPVVFLFDRERTITAGKTMELHARMGDNVFFFEI